MIPYPQGKINHFQEKLRPLFLFSFSFPFVVRYNGKKHRLALFPAHGFRKTEKQRQSGECPGEFPGQFLYSSRAGHITMV